MHYSSICLMFLMLCGSVPLFQGCVSDRTPKVFFPNQAHQFPEPFILGSEIVTTFSFSNEGNAPLHIQKIDSDCGCVATNASLDKIPPGDEGKIRVIVERDVGRFHQNVFVSTNDPARPIIRLEVSGVILPPVTYPKKVDFGQLEKGERVSKKFTFINNLKNTVEIIKYTVSNKSIVVTLPKQSTPVVPAGESLEIEAVLTLNDVGSYSESLTFSVQAKETLPGTASNRFEISIQFLGRVLGGIVVLPQNLFLGVLDNSGEGVQRKVYIKTDGNVPFALKQVSADNFSVAADLAMEPQTAYEVELSITPKTDSPSSGLVEGTIRIATDHPDVPEIAIPVKAVKP